MSKTITLELDEELYDKLRQLARGENRSLANFIETSVLRSIEQSQLADDYEMDEIRNNSLLNASLDRALKNVTEKKGHFVE